MDYISLSCLICLNKYSKFYELKHHVCTGQHQQKFKAVFDEEQPHRKAWLPYVAFLRPECFNQHKVGVSLLTLYYCTESMSCFYLCHVCEEKCGPDGIEIHLQSVNHCTNYFSYTDPNLLSFSWMPSMNLNALMRPWHIKEAYKKESVTLQFLNIPDNLKKKLDTCSYPEVMDTLRENDKLRKILDVVKPQRMMIQTYQIDGNREHTLLGLQHLVECICVGQTDKRHYLCTLCKQTLATNAIISHVLSFDHVYCYFEVCFPNTLLPKEGYTFSNSFVNTMIDRAKHAEGGTASTEIKQVSLDAAEFASVNFTCYEEALQKLESITVGAHGSSLMPTRNKPKVSVKSEPSLYKLYCQNCKVVFETESKYMKHLSAQKHTQFFLPQKLKELQKAQDSQSYEVPVKCSLALYSYLQESLEQNEPVVGVSLVVACVSSRAQVESLYICFACQNCFPESFLRKHFKSQKHLILTLLYQNPWRLPFAWKSALDLRVLKTIGWEEAKARGPDEMILKAFDIPLSVFHCLIPPYYIKVMKELALFHIHLKNKVPQCETYSRLQQNERFPLLGKQYLVIHACQHEVGFLCLLCKQTMTDDEFYAHVFSWKHVATFLNRFHPGSLSGNTDTAILLDLAKQAANLHPASNEQAIDLDTPICEPCPYETLIQILATAKRRRGGGQLEPTIKPHPKLFPRQSLNQVDNNIVRDNTQENSPAVEELEKMDFVKSTANEDTIEKMSVEPRFEISLKSDNNAKDGGSKETPTPCGAQPETSKARPHDLQNAVKETSQRVKEETAEETKVQMKKHIKKEITEELITREHISEVPQSCQNTVGSERAEAGQESSKSSKDVPTPRNVVYSNESKERKRSNALTDKSPEVMEGEMGPKRQRLNADEDSPSIESQHMPLLVDINLTEDIQLRQKTAATQAPSDEKELLPNRLWNYIQKTNREPVIGLSTVLECHSERHDPIYLCQSCSLKRHESHIISHVTNYEHQKNYMMKIQKMSSQLLRNTSRIDIRQLAASVEQTEGYGEAQVIDLDENLYQLISSQEFNLAIQTVKAVQAKQDGSTNFPSGVNLQVEDMDIDSNSETESSSITAPMFVVTETSSKEVPPESKVSDRTHSCPSVSRSVQDASSVHVSKSGTTMARLHSDLAENNGQNRIAQNTSLEVTISNMFRTSQTQAMCPGDKTTMTVTAPPASRPSCTAATTSMGKTTYKCSSTTDATTTLTAANLRSSANAISAAPISICSTDGIKPAYKCTTATTVKSSTSTICTAVASEHTAAFSSPTGSPCTSSVAASTTKSTSTKPPKSTNETWSKMTEEASCVPVPVSQTGSTRTQCEKASQTTVMHSFAAVTAKTSVQQHMKTVKAANADAAPRLCVSHPPAAPLEAPAASVKSGLISPSTELSHAHALKIKPKENRFKVGLNELILANCEKRRQVYCKLCSKRVNESGHTSTFTHQSNYVNKLYGPNTETRHFEKIVAHLAEAEKYAGTRKDQIDSQSVEVSNDVYKELASLRDDKAIEKLRMILKQKALQVPSVSTTDHAEVKLQVVGFSPCDVSSPDDGVCVPLNQTPGLSVTNRPVQENIRVTESPCTSELRSNLKEQVDHSDGALSRTEKGPGPSDLTPDQVQPFLMLKSDPDPVPPPSMQEADTTVTIKQERFDPFFETPAHIEVTPGAIQRPDPVEKPHGCAHSVAAHSESTPASLVTAIKQEPLSVDLLKTEREEPALFVLRPEQHSASQALPGTSEGDPSCMEGLSPEPVVGLGFVWKCRGTSGNSFYLCESCKEMFSTSHIAHASSPFHWYQYIKWQYPSFVEHWEEDYPVQVKLKALKAAAVGLSKRESCFVLQDVLLGPGMYNHVHSAPFNEALQIAKHVKKGQPFNCKCQHTRQCPLSSPHTI